MQPQENQRKAYIFGFAAVCLWSTVATAFKLSLRHLGPEPLVFYAGLTSILVLALILAVQGRLKELPRLTWKEARFSLLLAAYPALFLFIQLLGERALFPYGIPSGQSHSLLLFFLILCISLLLLYTLTLNSTAQKEVDFKEV